MFFPEPIFLLTTLSIEKSVGVFLEKIELMEEFGMRKQEVGFYLLYKAKREWDF